MKKKSVIVLLIFVVNSLYSQKMELGTGIGLTNYYGDLDSPGLFSNMSISSPAFQVFYNYYFNDHINARISTAYGTVSGNDAYSSEQWQKERNLSFKSSISEVTGAMVYNILGSGHFITPYLYGGINVFHYNPKTLYNGEWVELQPLGTEGQGSYLHPDKTKYNLYEMSLVFGGGFKFRINGSLQLTIDMGWRRTNTDYLDDVSTEYINYSELKRTNSELAAKLSDRTREYFGTDEPINREAGDKRGSNKINDYYTMTFLNFAYTLYSGNPFKGKGNPSCPKF